MKVNIRAEIICSLQSITRRLHEATDDASNNAVHVANHFGENSFVNVK